MFRNNNVCTECGGQIDEKSYTTECEYCLSKRED
nr:YhfH family protein [Cerasibacillus terrae]